MPRPNQTPGTGFRRALILRSALAPICRASFSLWSSLVMLKRRDAAQKPSFQLRRGHAQASLLLVQSQKLPLHRIAQLSKVGSTDRPAHGDEDIRTGLD